MSLFSPKNLDYQGNDLLTAFHRNSEYIFKTILVYAAFCLFTPILVASCDCQNYGTVSCIDDRNCPRCEVCFNGICEPNLEICFDSRDNDCDGEIDEGCEAVCGGIVCINPPPRECLDRDIIRYYLSPGKCINGKCRYRYEDNICYQGCVDDACIEDECIGMNCDDGNPCTGDACRNGYGCEHIPVPISCDDGDPCTEDDQCDEHGECISGVLVVCDNLPERECLDDSTLRYYLPPGECVEGACEYEYLDYDCEQGCSNDHCAEDFCIGLICDDYNPCTDDNCDPSSGCLFPANTLPCDDGNACTEGDACGDSVCVPGGTISCDDSIDCTEDSCDPDSGCVFSAIDARCEDGDVCTDDICDPANGCQNIYNTAPCEDGDPCTSNDTCSQGVCVGGNMDGDLDGFDPIECGGDDCDDSNPLVYPGAEERCDDLDNNCDGLVDMIGISMCDYEAFCADGALFNCADIEGPISSPTVIDEDSAWCAKHSPITVEANMAILQNAVLAVGPCVEVRAFDGIAINVRGELAVRATEDYRAVFTSDSDNPVRGSWDGIIVQTNQGGMASMLGSLVEYSTRGLFIEFCQCEDSLTVSNSLFRFNEISFSGYSGPTGVEVNDSQILDNGCGSFAANRTFRNCTFSGNDQVTCDGADTGWIHFHDCQITDNGAGIRGIEGNIENCVISNNAEYGIRSYHLRGFDISGNTITNNGIGIITGDEYDLHADYLPINNNTICENIEYGVVSVTALSVDATNNWWCSTDPEFISTRIFDVYDDASLGRVIFEPFLTEEPQK